MPPAAADRRRATAEEHARLQEASAAYEEAIEAASGRVEHEARVAGETCTGGEEVAAGALSAEASYPGAFETGLAAARAIHAELAAAE